MLVDTFHHCRLTVSQVHRQLNERKNSRLSVKSFIPLHRPHICLSEVVTFLRHRTNEVWLF